MLAAKSTVARLEGELPFLIGQQPQVAKFWAGSHLHLKTDFSRSMAANDFSTETTAAAPRISGATMDNIRKALDTPVKLVYHGATLESILADFRKAAKGVNFVVNYQPLGSDYRKFNADMAEAVPLRAALQ